MGFCSLCHTLMFSFLAMAMDTQCELHYTAVLQLTRIQSNDQHNARLHTGASWQTDCCEIMGSLDWKNEAQEPLAYHHEPAPAPAQNLQDQSQGSLGP